MTDPLLTFSPAESTALPRPVPPRAPRRFRLPPTAAERDSYFSRRLDPLTFGTIAAMFGLVVSGTNFALHTPLFAPYMVVVVVVLTLAYLGISLRVNSFRRDLSVGDHRNKVEPWAPGQ